MPLRKRFPFAMLVTIVALASSGSVNVCAAKTDASPVPIQFKNPSNLGVGKLLVASRGLGDPNFAETVILLIHYDDKGVVGLILNRRTSLPLSKVLDLKAAKDRSDTVYLGGPMEPSNVFALYQSKVKIEKAESPFAGVYLITDKDLFEQTISSKPDPATFHVYLGYAGWTEDQLRSEVKLGAWYVFPADSNSVFNSDPDSLWPQMIKNTELMQAATEPLEKILQPGARGLDSETGETANLKKPGRRLSRHSRVWWDHSTIRVIVATVALREPEVPVTVTV